MLERLFQLQAHGTNVRKELVAGITTFLTMAYIIVVSPSIMSSTGMDAGAVFVATCLATAIGIALGFITYAVIKALSGRWSDLNVSVVVIAVIFILKFIFLGAA